MSLSNNSDRQLHFAEGSRRHKMLFFFHVIISRFTQVTGVQVNRALSDTLSKLLNVCMWFLRQKCITSLFWFYLPKFAESISFSWPSYLFSCAPICFENIRDISSTTPLLASSSEHLLLVDMTLLPMPCGRNRAEQIHRFRTHGIPFSFRVTTPTLYTTVPR